MEWDAIRPIEVGVLHVLHEVLLFPKLWFQVGSYHLNFYYDIGLRVQLLAFHQDLKKFYYKISGRYLFSP